MEVVIDKALKVVSIIFVPLIVQEAEYRTSLSIVSQDR